MKLLGALLIGIFAIAPAYSCVVKQKPDEAKLDSYKKIFTGEVVGVRLSQYEDDISNCDKKKLALCPMHISDITEEHQVTIITDKAFKGDVQKIIMLTIEGCGIVIPNVHDRGIFFVKDNDFVIPLYEEDGQFYWYWMNKFEGIKNPDAG